MIEVEQEIKDLIDLLKKEYHCPSLHRAGSAGDITTGKIKSLFLYIVNFAYERNLPVVYLEHYGKDMSTYKTIVFKADKYYITISEYTNVVQIVYPGAIIGKNKLFHERSAFTVDIPYWINMDKYTQELPDDQLAWLYLQGVNLK